MTPYVHWSKIIIHHSAGSDTATLQTDDIDRQHTNVNKWADIGYHFVVEKVEGVYVAIVGRPLYMQGAHTPGQNAIAVGVCLVGNFSESEPPNEQLECAAKLVAGLQVALMLDADDIYPHRHFKATECPGVLFPWRGFVERVNQLRKGR